MLINLSSLGLLLASLTSGLPNEQRISDMGHNDCIQVSLPNLGVVRIFTALFIFFRFQIFNILCRLVLPWGYPSLMSGLAGFDLIVR